MRQVFGSTFRLFMVVHTSSSLHPRFLLCSLYMETDLHLVNWLRKIMHDWELDIEKLSKLAHTSPEMLKSYFKRPSEEIESLPSVPAGLENAVALVGVFRRIQGAYPKPEDQNTWLNRPNSVFEGNKPIDVMAMSAEHVQYVSWAVEGGIQLSPQKE